MGCCSSVSQSEIGIFETCGRFNGVASPGCHCFLPCTSVVSQISIRLREHEVTVESKTKDNVFVRILLVVQLQVMSDSVKDAYYKALSPVDVLNNHILNSIRAKIPLYKLEALYVERGTISEQLKEEVDQEMADFGVEIVSALIADIDPGPQITAAMNDIQRLQRLRAASVNEAETNKLKRVMAAEAACDARRLSGEGLAEQRKAIVCGLLESVKDMQKEMPELSYDDATNMMLMNQYFDTLENIAKCAKGSVMILETTGGLERMAAQLKDGVTQLMR